MFLPFNIAARYFLTSVWKCIPSLQKLHRKWMGSVYVPLNTLKAWFIWLNVITKGTYLLIFIQINQKILWEKKVQKYL